MGTTVRLLLTLAMLGFVAGPAQAHTIGIRDAGGTSTNVCGQSGVWAQLLPSDFLGPGFWETDFFNDCGEVINSIDFQLSFDGITPSHPTLPVDSSLNGNNIFNMVQGPFLNGEELVFRFFSTEGNNIDCTTCIESFATNSSHFFFFVAPDSGDPGFIRILDINQPTDQVVPEPATLLLLGSGLGAAVLKRRRRR